MIQQHNHRMQPLKCIVAWTKHHVRDNSTIILCPNFQWENQLWKLTKKSIKGLSNLQEPTNFQNRLETRESATSESTLERKSSIVQQKTFLAAIHFCTNLLARGVCTTTILGFIKQSSLPKHAHTYIYLSFTKGLWWPKQAPQHKRSLTFFSFSFLQS